MALAKLELSSRSSTAQVSLLMRSGAEDFAVRLLSHLSKELRVRENKKKMRASVPTVDEHIFTSAGFTRLKSSQELLRSNYHPQVEMQMLCGRWAVTKHIILLVEMLRQQRAIAIPPPPQVVLLHCVIVAAAESDRNQFAWSFFVRALLWSC